MRISDWSSDVGSSDLKRGRKLGTLEEGFASTLSPGDTFGFAGLSLEVERIDTTEMIVRATSKSPRIPTYGGTRLALSTNLAARVRRFLHEPEDWWRFPDDVREWLEVQGRRSVLPRPDQMLVQTFRSEEERVGKEWCHTVSTLWGRSH